MPTAARALAMRVLLRVEAPGSTLSEELATPAVAKLAANDRALLHELVLGTLRRRGEIDHALAHLTDRPLDRLAPSALLAILRLGAHQILHLRIPDHAAVSESVELARKHAPRARGMVNAVLRRLAREGPPSLPDPAQAPIDWLVTAGSLPRWLAERWLAHLGAETAIARATALRQLPPTALRLNPRQPEGARQFLERNPDLRAGSVPGCWVAPPGTSIHDRGGDVAYVQDEGSQIVGHLAARPGTLLDLCAAPGGKATLAGDVLGPSGRVVACEASSRRLASMAALVSHWGNRNVRCVGADALRPPFGAAADTVLLDAPCSGLGTLGRKPDVRWRSREAALPSHARRQVALLRSARTLVRPGGVLVYSVCSLEPEETTDAVEALLADAHELGPAPASVWPAWARGLATEGRLWRLPERDGGDGFFAAVLARRD